MDDTARRLAGAGDDDTTPRTEQIRTEIEQTRDELTETIDAIQDKLSPGNIVARAKDRVRTATSERVRDMAETASDTAQTMMDYGRQATTRVSGQVSENPIPAALIGVGAAWLLINRSQSRRQVTRWARGETPRANYADGGGMMRGNAIPAMMAAVGLGWLAFGNGSSSPGMTMTRGSAYWNDRDVYGRGDTGWSGSESEHRFSRVGESASEMASRAQSYAGDMASRAQDYAGGVAAKAQEYAGDMSNRAQAYASEAADSMRWRGRQAQNELARMMDENPLLVGAGALALGAAIGLALPETERENEWLGDARDRAFEQAEDMARTAVANVQEAAGDMVGDVASRLVKGQPS